MRVRDLDVKFELSDENRRELSMWLHMAAMMVRDDDADFDSEGNECRLALTVNGSPELWRIIDIAVRHKYVTRVLVIDDYKDDSVSHDRRVIAIAYGEYARIGEVVPQKCVVFEQQEMTRDTDDAFANEVYALLLGD
jgi:hypothetical protein